MIMKGLLSNYLAMLLHVGQNVGVLPISRFTICTNCPCLKVQNHAGKCISKMGKKCNFKQ